MKYEITQKLIDRFWSNVDVRTPVECWEWQLRVTTYPIFGIRENGKTMSIYAHLFSWSLVNGERQSGMIIHHKCNNKKCVNPNHLEQVTKKYNAQDAKASGLYLTGDRWLTPQRLSNKEKYGRY